MACSCMNPGDTGAERAAYVQNSEWTRLVFVGRVLNETSYSTGGEVFDGGVASMPRDFQNVTFSLDETLFNSNSSGSFPPNVIVGDYGTMTVETHTETTCCLCGLTIGEVGTEYLVELGKNSESLISCGITCQTNGWEVCEDTVTALGGMVADTPSNNETMSPTPAATPKPAPLITGPEWTVAKYYNPSNGTLVEPIEDSTITYQMREEDGRFDGNGGCNSMQGNYANLTSTSFVISSDVSWTEMYCAEPEGVMQQEFDYFSNFYLGRKIDWFPMGDWGLELKDADTGGAIATFKLDGMVESSSASPTPSGAPKAVAVDTDVGIAPTPTTSDASSNTILSPTTPTEETTSAPASG